MMIECDPPLWALIYPSLLIATASYILYIPIRFCPKDSHATDDGGNVDP